MLKAIEAVLNELGLWDQSKPVRYCVSISNGNTISVSAHVNPESFFQIKVSESPSFESEYAAQLHGWQKYGPMVPKPLVRTIKNGWDVFVAQGVPHEPIVFNAKGKGRAFDKMVHDLSHFFRLSANASNASETTISHELFLDDLEQYFNKTTISSIASRWIALGRNLGVCNLPLITQHGDFVLNNLAYCGKQPIIFDWEDYQKYYLPGFDLCSFCFSVASEIQLIDSLMRSRRIPDTAMGIVVRHACTAMNLDPDLLRRLIPLYLLGFLHAKRNYSADVQSRIIAAVTQLDHGD